MLRTTINMRFDVLNCIERAAQACSVSRRDIIVGLLMRVMRDSLRFQHGFSTVRYQADDPTGQWHCFSIQFRPDENEFWVDLRKVCKCSVSLLVALAVENYLDELVTEMNGGMHNYAEFSNYVLIREVVDTVICWHCYWGTPKNTQNTISIKKE